MKKLCLILTIIISVTAVFGSFATFADTAEDNVLTLEEAKALALKNDVQYRLQDSYIREAQEDYDEILEDSSNSAANSNSASKAASQISNRVKEENAAYSVQKSVLTKEDMRRASDYEVTDYYYTVIEAQNSVAESKRDVDQKKKSLGLAQFKYGLDLITKSSLNQAEESLASSQATYNKSVLELEKCILQLIKSIGEDLDLSSIKLDTNIKLPDISGVVLSDIKEDNLKNNLTYFNSKSQLELAEYEMLLTEDKCDYYSEHKSSTTDNEEAQLDDMLYDAKKAFDDAEYSHNEKLEELEDAVKDQYDTLAELYDTYEDKKEELEDEKLKVENNRIKLQLGLITSSELESSLSSICKLENQLYSTKVSIEKQYMDFTQYSVE